MVLVANGAVDEPTSEVDGFAVRYGIDGVGLENAAKSKLVGVLAERLRGFGVYVGEVTIAGTVGGTATASASAIDPAQIADRFWVPPPAAGDRQSLCCGRLTAGLGLERYR